MSIHPLQRLSCSVLVSALFLGGCAIAQSPKPAPASTTPAIPAPGSDADAHGCKASAGYRWCASTGSCVRPWELARERGFDNTPEALQRFCDHDEANAASTER